MENVWIENCVANENGGGIYKNGGSLSLIDCRLVNNNASWGGGLYNQNATVTIENTEIKLNAEGGWYNGDGSVSTLANSTITCNRPYQVNTNGTGVWTDLGGNDVGACVYTVCADLGGCDFTTIQDAIDYAQDGEIIEVWPGTYRADPWDSTSVPVVDMMGKAITLQSRDGAEVTIIHGDDERRGILCNSNENPSTIIQGFTIRDCSSSLNGSGIYCGYTSPTIRDCSFIECISSNYGGGAYLVNSNATIESCSFYANIASSGGGLFMDYNSAPVLTNCRFEGNSSYEGGGVYCRDSDPYYEGCTFTGNGSQYGSGLYNESSDPIFMECDISYNAGEGMWNAANTFVDIFDCVISGHPACAINNDQSSAWISDTTFCENDFDICGAWVNLGGNSSTETCLPLFTCSGDTNLDYNVDVLDILYILATWGTSNPAGDIDGNGLVDVNDVLTVVGNWGPCDD